MRKLYSSTAKFDKFAVENLGFSELVLQENAARAVAELVRKELKIGAKVLALCGKGNNAADAIATLRMINGEYECGLILLENSLNQNAQIQLNIAKNVGVKILDLKDLNSFDEFDCVVDGIFGSGFCGKISHNIAKIIEMANCSKALKIAVDIPSGISEGGMVADGAFRADFTVCMGALKLGLYADLVKDLAGQILEANLGLNESQFAFGDSDFLVLLEDLVLPSRDKQNVNKGDFGHAFIACGQMSGAAQIAANSALRMGAGRVSVVNLGQNILNLDSQIMLKSNFDGANAVAFGMGLGDVKFDFLNFTKMPCVVDADAFYRPWIIEFAKNDRAVLTPHPKEFSSLLKFCEMGELDVGQIQNSRFELVRKFSLQFPAVLVLKGANPIIAQNGTLYVAPQGNAKLAVGGSGDALAGLILAYLAGGFSPLSSAINGVLAHQKSAQIYKGNDYSFTPNDIIEGLKWL